jgi:SAM-dependent methyltransferase
MADDAATRWTQALQGWGIPAEILEQAPQTPWVHHAESFRPHHDVFVDTPSRHRALEALYQSVAESSLLDVGCGGGRAAFGLVPPAQAVIGVDRHQSMLDVFVEEATTRGIAARTILGAWPDIAPAVPRCDVVICHHVLYNVPDLVPFVKELTAHAKRRVVIELTLQHPLSNLSDAWKRFWNLERPTSPTAHDALAVVLDQSPRAVCETFLVRDAKTEVSDRDVEHTRIRLCLPSSCDSDVREFLESRPNKPRELATIWWDTSTGSETRRPT